MYNGAMNDAHPTIRDLLIEAASGTPIGTGMSASVYAIPGMDDYLLRAYDRFDHERFIQTLKSTSSLTPVHLCAQNVGQPLLVGESFQIIQKVEGNSFAAFLKTTYNRYIAQKYDEHLAHFKAEKDTLELLNSLPESAFEQLLRQMSELTDQGIAVEGNRGNVLLDAKTNTLRLVDVRYNNREHEHELPYENRWNIVAQKMAGRPDRDPLYFTSEQKAELKTLRTALVEKIERAAHTAGDLRNLVELSGQLRDGKIVLRDIEHVASLGKLSLEKAPQALRELLRKTQEHSQAQR